MIPGKIPSISDQEQFIVIIKQLYIFACTDSTQLSLYLDPMHKVHNNENDYAWQDKGIKGNKTVLANTGRRRLDIIGAINPVTFKPTILLTEENC